MVQENVRVLFTDSWKSRILQQSTSKQGFLSFVKWLQIGKRGNLRDLPVSSRDTGTVKLSTLHSFPSDSELIVKEEKNFLFHFMLFDEISSSEGLSVR